MSEQRTVIIDKDDARGVAVWVESAARNGVVQVPPPAVVASARRILAATGSGTEDPTP